MKEMLSFFASCQATCILPVKFILFLGQFVADQCLPICLFFFCFYISANLRVLRNNLFIEYRHRSSL